VPGNKLSAEERRAIVDVATSVEYRGQSPNQIVPSLADKGQYIASESSFYRILKVEGLQHHRSEAKPPTRTRPEPLLATGPNQVWSWDITYIKSLVKGQFFYLYVVMDVWSRKIMGWCVEDFESSERAAELITATCEREDIEFGALTLHSDNGSPMKGATMLATLQRLGVFASFSRPSVSNDNAFSEALFRTFKYRPGYPSKPFQSVSTAAEWVEDFVGWYNGAHLHSALRFVTPNQRHAGADVEILVKRQTLYEKARAQNPARWAGDCRNWSRIGEVVLNAYGRSARKAS
jgi:transposase InsO family protein